MGAVHLGRVLGGAGFARVVAIKRLHSHVAESPGGLAMFLDEARLSARVRHLNVIATLDVVEHERELLLVMEYVHGATLSLLARAANLAETQIPVAIAVAIMLDVLSGLQAVHDATDEEGKPLSIVHRDVSPENVLVGADGVSRLLDFGVAKAASRLQTTRDGHLKGKLRYMAPEQISIQEASPRTDQYSAAVVLWQLLTGVPLFDASNEATILSRVLEGVVIVPSRLSPSISQDLDRVVLRGLSRAPRDRFASCRDMANALRGAATPALAEDVRHWVETLAGESLRAQSARVARVERGLPAEEQPPAPPSTNLTQTVSAAPSAPATPAKRRTSARLVGFLLLTAVAGAGAAGVGAYARRGAERAVAPSPPPPVVTNPPAEPLVDAAVTERPVVSASATAVTSSVPSRRLHTAPRSHGQGAAPVRARPGCDPMFTVDENGIRRVKTECL